MDRPLTSDGTATSLAAALLELTKPRLTALVVLTAAAGFGLAGGGGLAPLSALCLGTALLAGGAGAANQWLETAADARMRRTRGRPLPSGRLPSAAAGAFAGALAAAGLALLAAASGPLSAWLGALSFVVYVAVYTPLKKVTTLCTPVGAVVGALPPLMGWAAATGRIDGGGLVLAALLFVWQIPHFLAIAWLYREDYAAGGFRMLPLDDASGDRTSAMVLLYAGALLPVSLSAVPTMATGWLYPAGAVALGGGFLLLAWRFARERSAPAARRLFLASLVYLPLVLALLALDPTSPAAGSPLR